MMNKIAGERDIAFDVLAVLRENHFPVEEEADELITNPADWHVFVENLRRACERRKEAER